MAKKTTAEKKSKSSRKSKKVATTLHNKVHSTVGRGVMAYFAAEEAQPEGRTSSPPEVSAELGAMLEAEVMAAGDAFEEARALEERKKVETSASTEPPAPEKRVAPAEKREPGAAPEPPARAGVPPARGEETKAPTPRESERPAPAAAEVAQPATQPGGILMEHPMEVEARPPGPGAETSPEMPKPSAPPATLPREEIVMRIADEHFKDVEEEINRLYDRIPKVLASNKKAADEALMALYDARAVLWSSPERLVEAEYRVNQVKTLMERHRLSEEWGRVYGRRLLLYETGWLIVLLAAFVGVQIGQHPLTDWVNTLVGPGGDTTYTGVLIPFLNSLVWGGIGGVVGALYSLWWHVSEMQDFDKRYNMWYLVQPIMGVVLGGIVYLIITTGFLVLQGTVPTTESARGLQMFPSLVAVLGGFRQKFVYELLERIIRVLTPTPGE